MTFLSSDFFHIVCVPILFVFFGVFANKLSRRDGETSPRKNDWAVATTMLLMILSTVAADLRLKTTSEEIAESLGVMLGLVLMLFMALNHERFNSWVRDHSGAPTNEKIWFRGIILPDLISIAIFVSYQIRKV